MGKNTLVIGATPNPGRYAFIATNMLQEYGHKVTAFGVKKGNIGSLPIVNSWPLNDDFNTITMYINPTIQTEYYQKIIDLKPARVIFNPGTENLEFKHLLNQNNIEYIEACTLVMLRTNQFQHEKNYHNTISNSWHNCLSISKRKSFKRN